MALCWLIAIGSGYIRPHAPSMPSQSASHRSSVCNLLGLPLVDFYHGKSYEAKAYITDTEWRCPGCRALQENENDHWWRRYASFFLIHSWTFTINRPGCPIPVNPLFFQDEHGERGSDSSVGKHWVCLDPEPYQGIKACGCHCQQTAESYGSDGYWHKGPPVQGLFWEHGMENTNSTIYHLSS